LGAFGGCGNSNDDPITSERTDVLISITYNMAKHIKENNTYYISDILNSHKIYCSETLAYSINQRDYWDREKGRLIDETANILGLLQKERSLL
jgi:hypothetical protein